LYNYYVIYEKAPQHKPILLGHTEIREKGFVIMAALR